MRFDTQFDGTLSKCNQNSMLHSLPRIPCSIHCPEFHAPFIAQDSMLHPLPRILLSIHCPEFHAPFIAFAQCSTLHLDNRALSATIAPSASTQEANTPLRLAERTPTVAKKLDQGFGGLKSQRQFLASSGAAPPSCQHFQDTYLGWRNNLGVGGCDGCQG